MSLLDLAIVVLAFAAVAAGWRLGFVARSLSWLGLALGVVVAALLLPRVLPAFQDAAPFTRLVVALVLVLGLGALGQGLGLAASTAVHRRLRLGETARRGDQLAGALVAVVGLLVGLWLLIPVLANVPGWPARAARESVVLRTLDEHAPEPPRSLAALGNLVGDSAGPAVFDALRPSPAVGPPPTGTLPEAVANRVAASTVKVVGEACGLQQNGSGWVVAPGVVVTNAHVVAGERRTEVLPERQGPLAATVVAFDPDRDVAVLRVPALAAAPLVQAPARIGSEGAVFGHPHGEPLRAAPARVEEEITAVGTNIYRSGTTRRQVLVLAAGLEPGDSGAAVVDVAGQVVGTAFAIDPSTTGTAYALTNDEVDAVVERAGTRAADTGGCLVE